MKQWFAVDKEGLTSLLDGKEKTFVISELVQNAFDENITFCDINLSYKQGKVKLSVEDDSPEGFRNISHAYTLFADTYKRKDPTKRGRFNLGEKLVLAICIKYGAEISTTKGTIEFHPTKGRIHHHSIKRKVGSIFSGTFRATRDEYEQLLLHVNKIIAPENVLLKLNGEVKPKKVMFKSFETKLETEVLTDNIMRKSWRTTIVDLYETDESYIYEIGIPIMKIDCKWSIDVQQKVPLTMDRNSVKKAYLKRLYTLVVNETIDDIPEEKISEAWVKTASENKEIEGDVLKKVLTKTYGDKFLSADPNNPVANDDALANGYKVLRGSELSKEQWKRAREEDLMHSTTERFGKQGAPCFPVKPTNDMIRFATFAKKVAKEFFNINISVSFVKTKVRVDAAAEYGGRNLEFIVNMLPKDFFVGITNSNINLLIHELGHEKGHHTQAKYHKALTKLGAGLTLKALEEPEFFKEIRK